MTTSARIGYGTLFKTGDGAATEVFTTFGEMTGIKLPKMKVDTHDVTHNQSPSGAKEFIAGLLDAGEVTIDFNLIPGGAGALALMTELGNVPRPVKNRQIVFPDGCYFSFAAFFTDFEPSAPIDGKMAGTATFKITGLPTLTQV